MGTKNSGVRHGHARTRHGQRSGAYTSWRAMIARCTQPTAAGFDRYRDLGVTLCDRWRVFDNFLADMGERPRGHTIERVNNALGYMPGNCRWATKREQGNNRRTNVRIVYDGREFTLAELARHVGINYDLLRSRLKRPNWTVKEAVEAPLERGRRRDLGH